MNDTETPDTDHLDDIDDGCGCTEVWEAMSEHREASGDGRNREQSGTDD